ncbi:MAG TPA: FAD-dependent oxidoreductase [Longimicrobiaceae bacterium]|nr:FAD-dependent oxidoreductase [Longimicrobiaceae bacterium]
MEAIDRTDRVCIVGAGSSGLAAARNLAERGFAADVLEREDDLGGNWNYGKPGARVYRSTHMISSKPFTQFPDFPMPASFPDYPHHAQVLEYLRAYAEHFGVAERIEYRTPVERLEPAAEGPGWEVTTGAGERRRYAAVVVANGHNWLPKWPRWEGEFAGEMLHSADYRTPDGFEGKRVLVIGGGNSGCDIVVEAAQHAARTLHSTRRGYWYMPKYVMGRPADQVGDALLKLRVPLAVRRLVGTLSMRLLVGPPERSGLPRPDHRLFETHPVVNSLLPYYVKHGDVIPRPDVVGFAGRTVRFADGTAEEVDVVVCATGYAIAFPFIDPALLNWRDGRPRLYKHVFHPERDDLFVAGMIQPDSGQFGLVHWQTRAVALFLAALRVGTPAGRAFRAEKRRFEEDFGHGIRYKESTRHYLEVEHWSYLRGLKRVCRRLAAGLPAPARHPAPARGGRARPGLVGSGP